MAVRPYPAAFAAGGKIALDQVLSSALWKIFGNMAE
jgi:hypothetical protein